MPRRDSSDGAGLDLNPFLFYCSLSGVLLCNCHNKKITARRFCTQQICFLAFPRFVSLMDWAKGKFLHTHKMCKCSPELLPMLVLVQGVIFAYRLCTSFQTTSWFYYV